MDPMLLLILIVGPAGGFFFFMRFLQGKKSQIKIYATRDLAKVAVERGMRADYLKEYYFTAPIRCENCKTYGTAFFDKGSLVEDGTCPWCAFEGDVHRLKRGGTKIKAYPVFTSAVTVILNRRIEEELSRMAEWGEIRRGGLFEQS